MTLQCCILVCSLLIWSKENKALVEVAGTAELRTILEPNKKAEKTAGLPALGCVQATHSPDGSYACTNTLTHTVHQWHFSIILQRAPPCAFRDISMLL
jgi:hypothetical protein